MFLISLGKNVKRVSIDIPLYCQKASLSIYVFQLKVVLILLRIKDYRQRSKNNIMSQNNIVFVIMTMISPGLYTLTTLQNKIKFHPYRQILHYLIQQQRNTRYHILIQTDLLIIDPFPTNFSFQNVSISFSFLVNFTILKPSNWLQVPLLSLPLYLLHSTLRETTNQTLTPSKAPNHLLHLHLEKTSQFYCGSLLVSQLMYLHHLLLSWRYLLRPQRVQPSQQPTLPEEELGTAIIIDIHKHAPYNIRSTAHHPYIQSLKHTILLLPCQTVSPLFHLLQVQLESKDLVSLQRDPPHLTFYIISPVNQSRHYLLVFLQRVSLYKSLSISEETPISTSQRITESHTQNPPTLSSRQSLTEKQPPSPSVDQSCIETLLDVARPSKIYIIYQADLTTLQSTPPSLQRLLSLHKPSKTYEGGGSSSTSTLTTTLSSPQPITYPEFTVQRGSLKVTPTNYLITTNNLWKPEYYLPPSHDHHPLIQSINTQHLQDLQVYCQQDPQSIVAFSADRPTMALTTHALRNLISHNKFINDEVVNLFLEALCYQHNYAFLSPTFLDILKREGGSRSLRHFASSSRHRHRTIYRPALRGESAIAIPCHIDNCHWVATVRREINNQVIFLFSDDLNNPSTENQVKSTLATLGEDFYPTTALWINCRSYTYLPHSNECGARTLLATAVMMTHPEPSNLSLLPYMHHNLAQIARTWIASALLSGQVAIPMLLNMPIPSDSQSNTRPSQPSSLIIWPSSPTIPLTSLHPTSQPIPSTIQLNLEVTNSLQFSRETGMAYHDRHQPKITMYLKSKSRNKLPEPNPTTPNTATPKQRITKKRRKRSTPNLPTPLPSLFDFPILPIQSQSPTDSPPQWGHALESIDNENIIRVILQNPNGIKPVPSDLDLQYSLSACNEIGASIISLSETNTSWHHFSQLSNTQKIFKKIWKTSAFQVSHSSENFRSNYKPGGTLTAVTGKWTSRITTKGEDPYGLGRWSYITLRGQKNKKVTFITAYRVCNTNASSVGEKTAYKQQYRHLSSKWREYKWTSSPDPHRQLILDLQAWIEKLIEADHSIILALDNNEDLLSIRGHYMPLDSDTTKHVFNQHHDGSLASLAITCGLVDILGEQHTERPFPSTYSRGKKRLDYILVSSNLAPAVLRSGILPYHSLFHSDHRPCYIDIDSILIFNENTHALQPQCSRSLQLTDPRKVQKYKEAFYKQLDYHKVIEKLRNLFDQAKSHPWSPDQEISYEKLDQLISESMCYAERKGPKYTKYYDWSPPPNPSSSSCTLLATSS